MVEVASVSAHEDVSDTDIKDFLNRYPRIKAGEYERFGELPRSGFSDSGGDILMGWLSRYEARVPRHEFAKHLIRGEGLLLILTDWAVCPSVTATNYCNQRRYFE